MAITVGDDSVLLDGSIRIKFLRDAEYDAAPPLVAFSGDNQTLIQCTPEGRLKVDTSVTIDTVDIGDVGVFLNVGGVNHLWNGILNPDGTTYAGWVQDQRMSFTGTRLRVDTALVFPSDYPDAGAHSRLDTLNAKDFATQATLLAFKTAFDVRDLATQTTLATRVADVTITDRLGADIVYATESYATTDADLSARPTNGDFATRRLKTKQILVNNTGANDARITIAISVDNGATFPFIILNNFRLNSGNILEVAEQRAFTHMRILARSNSAGNSTTISTSGYAQAT